MFDGWNQFGVVGSSTSATHGYAAARLTGPNLGGWDVSGYWQRFDSSPGEQWTASVCGWHTSTNPLSGNSSAILNIEWRNSVGGLIGYESHVVANASTPVDDIQTLTVTSGPAPSGTVATHFLLGVLQAPGDPTPDVYYDQATFDNAGPPSIDDQQWNDFPSGRTINFSDRNWRVKGTGYYGPGPNSFSSDPSHVWVDGSDQLHLTIKNVGGTWYSTEVVLEDALGYGDYIFTTEGQLDLLHHKVVVGMFLWQYGPCWDGSYTQWNAFNEIDVEISRWDNPANDVAQFVCQPWEWPQNINRFALTYSPAEIISYAFKWLPDRVEYRAWRGGPNDESAPNYIYTWTYTGPHVPRPEQPRVHLNMWQFNGSPTSDQEVVFDAFTFIPECVGPHCDSIPSSATKPDLSRSLLAQNYPNPFNPNTTIEYELLEAGVVDVSVYEISGRLVRRLVQSFQTAGPHAVGWNGRDESGRQAASGVYLYQLRTRSLVETRKMVLLK